MLACAEERKIKCNDSLKPDLAFDCQLAIPYRRNQWGTSWGAYGGFAYVQRVDTSSAYPYGNCGIGSDADYLN